MGKRGRRFSRDFKVELEERGFVVIDGPIRAERMPSLMAAYDHAVADAGGDDKRVGRSSTRVTDFVNRGPAFDDIYVFPPLLDAAARVIGAPFKLSSFHSRTLHPGAAYGGLHVDVRRGSRDWPLLGFILMIDDFRTDNGSTQFLPGSHRWSKEPDHGEAEQTGLEVATGAAGSLLVFHGSTWHGSGANVSPQPRRSLQGAFIPRHGQAGTDFRARMLPGTLDRLGPVARQVLDL